MDEEPESPGFSIRKMDHFESKYRRIIHFIMRTLKLLRPGSVLLEDKEHKDSICKNGRAWFEVASFIHRQGVA